MLLTLLLSLILISSIFGALCAAVGLIQSKKLFTTAPKDIQEAAKEHPERFPGQHVLGWKLAILCVAVAIGTFVYGGWNGIKNGFSFWQFFVRFLVMLYLWKAFDIVCLDWLLLTKSHFFQHFIRKRRAARDTIRLVLTAKGRSFASSYSRLSLRRLPESAC